MATKVTVEIIGGGSQTLDECATVGEAKRAVGCPDHKANVNGSPAVDSDTLRDYDYVALSQAIKGGQA